jgi:hypothetical protein
MLCLAGIGVITMNQNKHKKVIIYVGLTFVMVLLGAVAVITAMRLQQLATEPVAPNVPQSKPQAAALPTATVAPTSDLKACITDFSVAKSVCQGWCNEDTDCATNFECYMEDEDAEDPVGKCVAVTEDCLPETQTDECTCAEEKVISCKSKVVYKNVSTNTAGNYDLSDANKLADNANVSSGDKLVYVVSLISNQANGEANGAAVIEDVIPNTLDILDYNEEECSEDGQTITCDFDGTLPKQYVFWVQVKSNITASVDITNKATVVDENDNEDDCSATVKVVVGPTSTPTPGPTATPTPGPTATPTPPQQQHLACVDESCEVVAGGGENLCDTDADCEKETHLACVNEACEAVDGGGADLCSSDSECLRETHLACVSQSCTPVDGGGSDRCTGDSDCIQPTPVPTVTTPDLPQAGGIAPTLGIITMGAVLLMAGLVGLLLW